MRDPSPTLRAEAQAPTASRKEPLWLVRIVFVLVLVGFAAFLAREINNFAASLP